MILAKKNSHWYLAAFARHIRGCNLSTNQKPDGLDAKRFRLWKEHIYVWSQAPLDGITFYPTLHYRGMIVHPVAWDPESTEPVLKVLAGRWLRKMSQGEAGAIMESLRQQGWDWDHHHGSGGYVHVEDPALEKIEGSPPRGTF